VNIIAVLGDVVGSRSLKNRPLFQARLETSTKQTNDLSRLFVLSPFTVTLGDEVQAVYRIAGQLVDHLLYLWGGISPQRMRFSIGVGAISTPLNRKQSIGMDGPAFHAARDGLERQRVLGKICAIWPADGWKGPDLTAADAALEMLSIQVARWRPARWVVVRHLIEGLSETETATKIGVGRQAVNQHVLSGSVRAVRRAGEQIDAALTRAVTFQ
jgi:hypothetical protein